MRKRVLFVSLAAMVLLALSGCTGIMPGFRFAPGEPQKQTAQAGADLATVAASRGLPPDSMAARQMAKSAYAGAVYAGPPKQPTDVSPLLPPAVTNAWNIMQRRAEAMGLKRDILDRTADITAERLADLAADIEGKAKVDADRIVFRATAIVEGQKMGAEIADVVPIPGLDALSPEEAERLSRMDKALSKIQATATAQAARRPTVEEVVDAAEDQALNTADRIFGILEDYGLTGLLAGTGLGGMALAVRKRRQAKEAAEDAKKAAEDAKFAKIREQEAKATAEKAVANAHAEAAKVTTAVLNQVVTANGQSATPSAD